MDGLGLHVSRAPFRMDSLGRVPQTAWPRRPHSIGTAHQPESLVDGGDLRDARGS